MIIVETFERTGAPSVRHYTKCRHSFVAANHPYCAAACPVEWSPGVERIIRVEHL